MSEIKRYCEGIDCSWCGEKEPCIYRIANGLQSELTAKEKECEELKIYIESNEQQVKEVETLVMDNDRLINELDQLKEQFEAYKMEAEEGKEINTELKLENKHLNDLLNQALKELEKTRETLTEIKEIAEIRKDDINDWLAKEILQKISEVEDDMEND